MNSSVNTIKNYNSQINRFKKSGETIEVYFSKLSGSDQKMFLAAAKYFDYDISNISKMKRNEPDISSTKVFSLKEILMLRNKIKEMELKYQAVVLTMLETGARREEVVKIWCEFQDKRTNIVWIKSKGDKTGKIFITNELKELLNKWVDSDKFKVYSNEQIHNITVEALKYVGLYGSCHILRRTLATNLRRHFVPIEHIQILLRHNNIETTIRQYVRISEEEIFNSLEHKYTNVDEFVNKSNFREKYLELLQLNMAQARRIEELESELNECSKK